MIANADAEECKRQYEKLSQEEKDKYGYSWQYFLYCDPFACSLPPSYLVYYAVLCCAVDMNTS